MAQFTRKEEDCGELKKLQRRTKEVGKLHRRRNRRCDREKRKRMKSIVRELVFIIISKS